MAGHLQTNLLITSKLFLLVDAHYTLIYAQPYSWNQYHNSNTRHNRYCMWLGSILKDVFHCILYIHYVSQPNFNNLLPSSFIRLIYWHLSRSQLPRFIAVYFNDKGLTGSLKNSFKMKQISMPFYALWAVGSERGTCVGIHCLTMCPSVHLMLSLLETKKQHFHFNVLALC